MTCYVQSSNILFYLNHLKIACKEKLQINQVTNKYFTKTVHAPAGTLQMPCLNLISSQVAWIGCQDKLTWISSSALPQDMIYEYEQGIIHQENIEINRSYGVTKHTITTNTIKSGPPPSKKARIPTVTFLAESV